MKFLKIIGVILLLWIALNTTPGVTAYDNVQDVRIVGHSGLRYDPLPVVMTGGRR